MIIREAISTDANTIADMHADNWRATYRGSMKDSYLDGNIFIERRQLWRARLASPVAGQHVIVAQEGAEITGFCCSIGNENAQWGSMLDNLHVAGHHKGQGIGELLMRETASWLAIHYPGMGMYLWVLEANLNARRFYERLGGSNTERDLWLPPDGSTLPCLRYVWPNVTTLLHND